MRGQLLDERSVAVQPSLVRALGITRAIVLQQIHWHSREHHGEELSDGNEWVALPLAKFSDETGLTIHQCRRAVDDLEEREVILSTQPEGYIRTKWYRVNLGHDLFVSDCPSGSSATSNRQSCPFQVAPVPTPPYKTSKNEKNYGAVEDSIAAAGRKREQDMEHTASMDAEFSGPTEAGREALAAIKARLRGGRPVEDVA
jgi:hypothetical protein